MNEMSGLDTFFEPLGSRSKSSRSKKFSKRQIRGMSKKQLRKALLNQGPRKLSQRPQEPGLGLAELIKSKEFKQRVELLKEGSRLTVKGTKIAYKHGRIAATKLASRIRKARSKSIYD